MQIEGVGVFWLKNFSAPLSYYQQLDERDRFFQKKQNKIHSTDWLFYKPFMLVKVTFALNISNCYHCLYFTRSYWKVVTSKIWAQNLILFRKNYFRTMQTFIKEVLFSNPKHQVEYMSELLTTTKLCNLPMVKIFLFIFRKMLSYLFKYFHTAGSTRYMNSTMVISKETKISKKQRKISKTAMWNHKQNANFNLICCIYYHTLEESINPSLSPQSIG